MTNQTNNIESYLNAIKAKGLSIDDDVSCRLYIAALQGSSAMAQERANVRAETYEIISPDLSEHNEKLYEELMPISHAMITQQLISKYHIPLSSATLSYLMKNFINSELLLRVSDLLLGLKKSKLDVVFNEARREDILSSDPLGQLVYSFESGKLEMSIFINELIRSIACNKIIGEGPLDLDSHFVMVMVHELAHLISAQVYSREDAQMNKKILELRGVDLDKIDNFDISKDLLLYRTGYILCGIDGIGSIEDEFKINEAITEIVAEDIYNYVISSGDFPDLEKTYQICYVIEVDAFKQALKEHADTHFLDHNELLSSILKGYFCGGEDGNIAVKNIILPIYPRYRELVSQRKTKTTPNILA